LSNFLWFIMATLVLVLLFSATITITLRRYSRSRTQRLLQQRGREAWMKRLVSTQNELAQCMAVLRTSCTALLVLAIFHGLAALELDSLRTRYGVAFVATLTLFVTFGVAIPSAWAKYAGEPFLVFSLPLLWGLHTLMYPLLLIARIFDGLVRRLAGAPEEDSEEVTARHEQELLDAVSEGEIVGAVNEDEREMIESVMELRDSDVEEIMTPRTEIRAVPTDCTLAELKDLIGKIGHSRIPIFEETIDNIVGIIYAKDLLHVDDTAAFDARATMREALFVPETKNLSELLNEFRTRKVHMAIVLDEYGGTAGLVTIEDILEEVVGEIVDEYDQDEPAAMTRIDAATVEIDARMRVDELNEELGLTLPEVDDYETIGGFVFSTMGHIPQVGERCTHQGVEIQVIDAEPRRINRLRLRMTPVAGNGREVPHPDA
jgi:putative hemolysin